MGGALEFRLGPFPVRIEPIFLLLAVFLGLRHTNPASIALFVVVALVSVLWHEVGHAAAFRAFGYDSSIMLHGMGGLTMPHTDRALPAGRDLIVSLAGPVAGILAGGAVLVFARPEGGLFGSTGGTLMESALGDIVWVNLGWALLNLVPILPLDGGRVMKSLLNLATDGRGERPARFVSIGVGGALAVAALMTANIFAVLLLAWFVYANVQDLQQLIRAPKERDLDEWLDEGRDNLGQGALLAASNRAREVLRWSRVPETQVAAAEILAWALLLEGKIEQGAEILASVPPDANQPVLQPSVLAVTKDSRAAIELLRQAFEEKPGGGTGTRVVRALIESHRLDDALAVVNGPLGERAGNSVASVVGHALFQARRYDDAARVGERSFGYDPHPMLAYNVACSWARAGNPEETVNWLNRAIDIGYRDLAEVDAEADFADLRNTDGFARARARLAPDELERSSCYRHAGTTTALACSRCGRPICVTCAVPTAGGWSCPECEA